MRPAPRTLLLALVLVAVTFAPVAAQTATDLECAKTWHGREAELEDYLRSAPVVRTEPIGLGVTNPRRAYLPAEGPIASMAWKPIRPGIYNGYWESYRSEVAAYLMDRLLGLGMVPPVVERTVSGEVGAAIMWLAPVKMWRDVKPEERPSGNRWAIELIRQRMFDNLIANSDRNQGNLLIDPDGHLCLIDHSRAFTTTARLEHRIERVDARLWAVMAGLTEESLTEAMGRMLDRGRIRAILRRRDRMADEIDKLVKERGPAAVFIGAPR